MSRSRVPDPLLVDPAVVVEGWFDLYVGSVHSYLARRVGGEVAAELTAETFRLALEGFEGFESSRGDGRSWLFGIATNLLRRHWRTEQRRLRAQARIAVAVERQGADQFDVSDRRLDAQREIERVARQLEQLSPEDRDLIVLVAVEGFNSSEASSVLGVPAGTVRSRLSRIRSQLGTLGVDE